MLQEGSASVGTISVRQLNQYSSSFFRCVKQKMTPFLESTWTSTSYADVLCIGTTVSAVTLNMYLKTAVSCYNIYAPRTLYLRVLVVLSLLYAKLMLCCSFPCTLWLLPIHVHTTHYYNFPKPKWSIPICIGRGGVRHSLVSTFSLQEASACFSVTWQYHSSAKES